MMGGTAGDPTTVTRTIIEAGGTEGELTPGTAGVTMMTAIVGGIGGDVTLGVTIGMTDGEMEGEIISGTTVATRTIIDLGGTGEATGGQETIRGQTTSGIVGTTMMMMTTDGYGDVILGLTGMTTGTMTTTVGMC